MAEYPAVHLKVTPEAIPQLRAAFDRALDILSPELATLGQVGHIQGRWLGDPKSQEVVDFYNANVMDAEDGPYQGLLLYKAELIKIRDQLTLMEREYQRVEDENVGLFSGSAL